MDWAGSLTIEEELDVSIDDSTFITVKQTKRSPSLISAKLAELALIHIELQEFKRMWLQMIQILLKLALIRFFRHLPVNLLS